MTSSLFSCKSLHETDDQYRPPLPSSQPPRLPASQPPHVAEPNRAPPAEPCRAPPQEPNRAPPQPPTSPPAQQAQSVLVRPVAHVSPVIQIAPVEQVAPMLRVGGSVGSSGSSTPGSAGSTSTLGTLGASSVGTSPSLTPQAHHQVCLTCWQYMYEPWGVAVCGSPLRCSHRSNLTANHVWLSCHLLIL